MAEQKIGILTDSAGNLSPELQQELDITMIPLRINFSNAQYRDGVELTSEMLYSRMKEELPKSSLPSAEDILAALDAKKAEGCTDVVFVCLSSGLSGCYNFVRLLAAEYEGMNVTVYDSKILSCGQQSLLICAHRVRAAGGSVGDIIAAMDTLRQRISSYFCVRTLEYLSKGGRIGKVAGTVGSLLHLCPVISVNDDGVYVTSFKTIGFGRAVDLMLKDVENRYASKKIVVSLVHALDELGAKSVLERIKGFANVVESYINPVSPVLGIHTGVGLIGMVVFEP